MEVVRRVNSMKEICGKARSRGRRVALVPTMGALHEGHLSLMRRARELSDLLVVSIFVNPTQFGPSEDFEHYPRDLTGDVDQCVRERVDHVFVPEAAEIYPQGAQTFVEVTEISRDFEGAVRAGHFRGVTTVVMKLFEVVRPALAVFGQKDAQQAAVIRRMARDLLLDVEIVVLPTVRDEDGLALSSRNRNLSPTERRAALAIPRSLSKAREVVTAGERGAAAVVRAAREVLDAESSLELDYLELVDRDDFRPVERISGETCLVVAARVGATRLLDNVTLEG